MKKSNLHLLFVGVAFLLILASCDSTEYRNTDGGYCFVIKKVNHKRVWGISGQPDHEGKYWELLPCQYDTIYSVFGSPYNMEGLFIVEKDGKKYAYSTYGRELLFEGKNINELVGRNTLYKKYSNSTYGNLYNKAYTDDGIYFFQDMGSHTKDRKCFGPYEDFFHASNGYAYKKNGKWGVMKQKIVDLTPTNIFDDRYEYKYLPVVPAQYDGAIEINGPLAYWLLKKGNSWITVGTESGLEIKRPSSTISLFLGLPILDYERYRDRAYHNDDRSYNYKRIGGENYGSIWIEPFNGKYIAH